MGRGGARSLLVSELSESGTVQQLHAAIFDQELSSAAIDLHFFTDGLTRVQNILLILSRTTYK